MNNQRRKREQGFTLMEIIAVIILLAVLAATVIPKFSNLTKDAQEASLNQAIAEGISRVNMGAASYILKNDGNLPSTIANLGVAASEDIGDYTLGYAMDGTTGVTITATFNADTNLTLTGTAQLPTTN